MKITMHQVKSFIKFDFPIDKNYISTQFASTHLSMQSEFPESSTEVSRQKLISAYWFNQVAGHFAFIVGISVLLSVLLFRRLAYAQPGPVLIAALVSFPILLLFHYWPSFSSQFLPKLEMIISGYKHEKQEKIIQQLKQELKNQQEKARIEQEQIIMQFRDQLSIQQDQAENQRQQFQIQLQEKVTDQQEKARIEQEQIIMQFSDQLTIQQDQAENQRQQFQIQLQEKVTEQQAHLLKQQETIQYRFQYKIANQKEQIDQQQDSIKKCHQAQLSNFALTAIYYAFAKAAGHTSIKCSDSTASLLLKLYGVDKGSLRSNLKLICATENKRKNLAERKQTESINLGERKQTELRNRFEEAVNFFNKMGFSKGATIVTDLEKEMLGS
jgi:hypothetical protein